jgi:hypothetical protein
MLYEACAKIIDFILLVGERGGGLGSPKVFSLYTEPSFFLGFYACGAFAAWLVFFCH